MKRPQILAAAVGCLAMSWSIANLSAQTVLFSSEMTNSAGWGYSHFGGNAPPNPLFDTTRAEFNWDYSALGIPEAPNSAVGDAGTRGLRLAANVNASAGGDAIAVVFEDASFDDQYTLQVDVWANWSADPQQNGTTEHPGVYAGFDLQDVNPITPGQNGAGLLFDTDGDCGNCDYILTKDAAELDTFSGQYGVIDFGFGNQQGYDNTDSDGGSTDLPGSFPSFDIATATNNMNGFGTQPAGALGFQWVTVTVEVDANAPGTGTNGSLGTAKFSVRSARSGNSVTIGTIQNSVDDNMDDNMDGTDCGAGDICTGEAPVGLEGGIGLMLVDFFSSNASNPDFAFTVFDNVRVYDGFLSTIDGDFNNDGFWDCADINDLSAAVAAMANDPNFDLNGDTVVDTADIAAWLVEGGAMNPALTGGNPFLLGDATLDGVVDGQDFITWNGNKFTSNTDWCGGNFNGDAVIDGQDFITWNQNKFMSSDSVSAVPEPATVGSWVLVLSLAARRRRR